MTKLLLLLLLLLLIVIMIINCCYCYHHHHHHPSPPLMHYVTIIIVTIIIINIIIILNLPSKFLLLHGSISNQGSLSLSAIPKLLPIYFHVLSSCCMISFLTPCSCGDPSHLLFTLFWIFIPYFFKKTHLSCHFSIYISLSPCPCFALYITVDT